MKHFSKILLITLFVLLLLNPKTAFAGAKNGLLLWAGTILPSLLPAMIISTVILKIIPLSRSYRYIYITVCGLFSGYPLGAMLCAQFHREYPDETFCQRLMPLCNISSPSFVINYILQMPVFANINTFIALLAIYLPIAEALAVTYAFKRIRTKASATSAATPVATPVTASADSVAAFTDARSGAVCNSQSLLSNSFTDVLDNSLTMSVKNMLKLGGYITLFACLSAILNKSIGTNRLLCVLTTSLLEITNGIHMCAELKLPDLLSAFIIICVNASGGICTIAQTMSVISDSGLSIKKYIYHKLILTALTAVNTILIIYVLY